MDSSLRIKMPQGAVAYDPTQEDGGYLGLSSRLSWQLAGLADVYVQQEPRPPDSGGGPGRVPEMLVRLTVGIANMSFALKEILRVANEYLNAYEGREFIFEIGGKRLTLKGHSQAEEIALLQHLLPDILDHLESVITTSQSDDLISQRALIHLQFLKQIYGTNEHEDLFPAEIGQQLSWSNAVLEEIINYLREEGLIEVTSLKTVRITATGRLAVADSILRAGQISTLLMPHGININVKGDFNVGGDVVGRDKSSTNLQQ